MVTVVGRDRPGVVSALAGVLVELGCNMSDTQMAVLQGYSSMMVVTDAPDSLCAEEIEAALTKAMEEVGHAVWVRPLEASRGNVPAGRRWLVSVHGADRPGVVFEVTRLLAEAGINVIDLESRQLGRQSSLSMKVDVPTAVDGNEVAAELDRLGEELGLSSSMRPMPERP